MDALPALVLPKEAALILVQIKCKVLLVNIPKGLFYLIQFNNF